MAESVVSTVKSYIDEFIFHSDNYDKLPEDKQTKAIKSAEKVLYLLYKQYEPEKKPLPTEAIAHQTMWILEKDASIRKAELGVASQSIEGMTVSFKGMDRSVAPEVKRILQKRVGSYALFVDDTNRGMYRR